MTAETRHGWRTFRELDETRGYRKGHTFRCFKTLNGQWMEGREFVVLDARRDARQITRLKHEGRLYGGTVNAVLLSPDAARAILSLSGDPGQPSHSQDRPAHKPREG